MGFILQNSLFSSGLELWLKSLVLLSGFMVVAVVGRRLLGSNTRHLIWVYGLLSLTCLPWFPLLSTSVVGEPAVLFNLSVVPEATGSNIEAAGTWLILPLVLLLVYAVVAAALLLKLLVGVVRIFEISRCAEPVDNQDIQKLFKKTFATMKLRRPVRLVCSDQLATPVSFGLLRPVLLLPTAARDWDQDMLADVFLHELAHIRRLDWPVMLLARAIASVFWVNPLVWFVLARLNLEAENCCDEAVVQTGREGADYARSLVAVARVCRSRPEPVVMAQAMVSRSTLGHRVHTILEHKIMKTGNHRKITTGLFVGALAALALVSNFTLLSPALNAQGTENREEMFPLVDVIPQYPTVAAEQGIEGWVHVRFDVTPDGGVDTDSIGIVDAEPAEVFNASAMRATEKFRFSPRRINGEGVRVDNVQYVFRYRLSEEQGEPTWDRSPPAARSR